MLAGWDAAPRGRGTQPRTRAPRGSAWWTLGSARQELAETGANALKSAARGPKNAASGAPGGAASFARMPTPQGVNTKVRRSALHPSDSVQGEEKETATGRRDIAPGRSRLAV